MPAVKLSPIANLSQYFTDNNQPLNEGLLYTYEAGTVTPLATYTTDAGSTPNSNPIELDASGRPPHGVWLIVGSSYDFVLKDSDGNTIDQALDVTGINDGGDITFTDLDVSGNTTLGNNSTGGNTTINLLTTGQEFKVVTLEGDTFVVDAEGNTTITVEEGDEFLITGDGTVSFVGVDVDFSEANSVDYLDGSITVNDLSEEVLNLILSSGGGSGGAGIASGDGRLSLASGVKVMLTDYTGITSIYYVGGLILTLNEGSGAFAPFQIGELSQALADTNYSPSASQASKAYDMFGWKDTMTVSGITRSSTTATVTTSGNHNLTTGATVFISGAVQTEYNGYQTLTGGSSNTFTFEVAGTPATPATGTITAATARLSRGPAWRNRGQAVTGATNATPIVLTVASSGISSGDVVMVENVGGNTAANGEWEVTVSGDNVTLVGSVGNGVYISGTGSIATRGTGTGTTEIEALGNSYVNAEDITNGPDAQMGTYLGTIATNGSNELDWKLGSIATGGGEAWLGVWNVSNAVTFEVTVTEATASWTMGAGSRTFGPINGSTTNRISFIRGLNLAGVSASQSICLQPGGGTGGGCTIAADSTTEAMQGQQGALASYVNNPGGYMFNTTLVANARGNTFFGFHFLQGMEENSASIPASTQATPVFAGNLNGAHTGLYGVVLNARLTQ